MRLKRWNTTIIPCCRRFVVVVLVPMLVLCTAPRCTASANPRHHWESYVHQHSMVINQNYNRITDGQQQRPQQLHLSEDCEAAVMDDNDDEMIDPLMMITNIHRGGGFFSWLKIPAGYNPFGFKITEFGELFLTFDGSLESDIGRFLASLKSDKRKTMSTLKSQWLEIVRVSKSAQTMRIYRQIQEFIDFCLQAGFID